MNRKLIAALAATVAVAIGVTACSSSKSKTNTNTTGGGGTTSANAGSITVGSAAFPESVLLADIYADALSAKGVKVTKKLNIGERTVYFKALQDGSISFFPEYNGSALVYLDPNATAKSTDDVNAALATKLGSSLTALKSAAAQDSDTITVRKDTADKYHLTTIADLAPVAKDLKIGAPPQFQTRADGLPALKSVYGITFGKFVATSASGTVTVQSLKNGSIDAADLFSTDGAIAANNFVILQDTKSMFAAQNITPIVATAKNTQTITDAANAVSAKLDTATLASLVAKVGSGTDPDKVAKDWLASVNLG